MAKNICLSIDGSEMDVVKFGKGKKNLVMIPGLGDGIKSVKDASAGLALSYSAFAKEYTVYVFSRKRKLAEGCTTEHMAKDQSLAMELLGIEKASVIGVSQGGMIAQHLAADFPEKVEKLVLAVTAPKSNEIIQNVVGRWIELAKKREYKKVFIDTAENSYSEKYLKAYRPLLPLLSALGIPNDHERFLIQASSCLTHDASQKLCSISCPTLIIGAQQDKTVGVAASEELANSIRNSELYIYNEYGHAAYEEAKDFNSRVLAFLKE